MRMRNCAVGGGGSFPTSENETCEAGQRMGPYPLVCKDVTELPAVAIYIGTADVT